MVRFLTVFFAIALCTPGDALNFPKAEVTCGEVIRDGTHYTGLCRSRDFYIEWTTTRSLLWLHQGRDEVFDRIREGHPPLVDGMYSGLSLLRRDYRFSRDEVILQLSDTSDLSFCQFGKAVPKAADRYSLHFQNESAQIELITGGFFDRRRVLVDFTQDLEADVARCFIATSPALTIDFFPVRRNLEFELFRALLRVHLRFRSSLY